MPDDDDILDAMLDGDEVGFEEISGMSDEEIGARVRRSRPRKNKMYGPTENIGRLAPIGFGPAVSIVATGNNTFTATVQRPGHIRRLLITSDNPLSELAITSLRVGDVENLMTGEIPATLYDLNAQQGFPDNFTVLKQNATISVGIRNDGAGASVVAVGAKAQVNR